MKERYYHYNYEVEEFGEKIPGNVTYPGTNEQSVTAFIRSDIADTYPDGAILSLKLTAVTDAEGRRISS
jgi:hypothetical protein